NIPGSTVDTYGWNARWGYYYDSETGLYLCQQRYYDSNQGRWLNRDPIGYAGGVNVYGYCGGSPVGWVDSSGENPFLLVVALIILTTVPAEAPTGQEAPGDFDRHRTECAEQSLAIASLVYSGGGFVSGLLNGIGKATMTVTRWGDAGLKTGQWVQQGEGGLWNWIKSGKIQPGKEYVPVGQSTTYVVPKSEVVWPKGWGWDGWWKGLLGQRKYVGPPIPK
ncbi:MAG: RHS repeat-associated core domain-containing protein, partial [Chthonomonadaceae bacterium]|nr:RHS repeat-associated core domain-containing protein [Chthonomonadaceae bacterium]